MTHALRTAALAAAVCVALVPLGSAAQPQAPADALIIAGDVPHPLTVALADLKAMPRTTVTTVSEDGQRISYEGVLVGELLKLAGAPLGRDLSGKAIATYVRAGARDGYVVVFSLPELDPAFTTEEIIVADAVDGKPLSDAQGPLRIVAPHDKRGARSIRMLQRIDVVRLVK